MSQSSQTKLVILGGGAAGLMIAMQLSKTKYLEITLIDNKVCFVIISLLFNSNILYSLFTNTLQHFAQFFLKLQIKNLKSITII